MTRVQKEFYDGIFSASPYNLTEYDGHTNSCLPEYIRVPIAYVCTRVEVGIRYIPGYTRISTGITRGIPEYFPAHVEKTSTENSGGKIFTFHISFYLRSAYTLFSAVTVLLFAISLIALT